MSKYQIDDKVRVWTTDDDPLQETFVGRVVGVRTDREGRTEYTVRVHGRHFPAALDSRYPAGTFRRSEEDVLTAEYSIEG